MKKRVVSLLLALVMLTSLVPTTVWAEDAYSVAPDTEMQDILQKRDNEGEQEDDPALAGRPMLSTVMPAAVTLTGSGTEDDPYQIGSAEELASLSGRSFSGKSYRLTQDIDMENVPMQPIKEFADGTFDGNGYTISNLTISAASGNAGLFAETNSSTVFKDIILHNVSVTLTGGSSAGVGGLIGKIYGSTTIQGCGVSGVVAYSSDYSYNSGNVGGLVGYLNGKCTIKESYSRATIDNKSSNSSSTAGGLLGKTGTYTLSVTDCYASGDVTAAGDRAGGFTGYVYCSNSYRHTYENCYAAGTVKASAGNGFGFAYSYASTGYRFKNCYYNNTANGEGCNKTDTTITGKSADELKALAGKLGEAYQKDAASINGGYPILTWQYNDPDATPTVTVTVTPADAKLIWDGMEQTGGANGVYTLTDQTQGQHTYTVSHEAGDYAAQTGTITVKSSDMTKTFTLALNRHKLTFNVQPENAELTVKSGTTELTAESENTYSVVNGTYTYTAELFGYKTAQGSVAVDRADKTHTVTMQAEPAVTVTFANADKGQLTVVTGERTMSPDKNGAYALPVGYRYDWTFKSANYAKQTGSIDLTGVTEDGTRTVTIPLAEKTAWGGADDIVAPTKVGDVYQIGSGGELAWFAQEVNAGRGAAYNAVLTKDIDLGDEPWTPIGKNYSYAYKGTFDGQKHTVSGLFISGSASQNCGLFGYVEKGTVKDLTVKGTITLTGGGSSSYGAGGIVGQLSGTEGSVRNCRSDVAITGGQNVGGIVGYVSSGYSTATKSITGCVNTGTVSSNSYNAGGIVGYINGQVTVDSCYNRGNCTSGSYRAGGIAAYLYSSYATVKNCYTTGVTKVAYGNNACAVVGNKSSGAMKDCFYLSGLTADANATAKTSDELKALAAALGDAFVAAPKDLNDGYPVLRWQIPTYAVTFTVAPADAVVTIDGQTSTHAGGQWVFKLPDGTYTYTVSAFGYVQQSDTVTVSSKALAKDVTLTAAAKRTVTFTVTPAEANAAITVTWNG